MDSEACNWSHEGLLDCATTLEHLHGTVVSLLRDLIYIHGQSVSKKRQSFARGGWSLGRGLNLIMYKCNNNITEHNSQDKIKNTTFELLVKKKSVILVCF